MNSSELDFSQRIRELCKDFIGRQWLFQQVDHFLKSPGSKYFVISGEPGIGKSAIAASLVQQRKTHAHHFCRAQEGTTVDAIAFVRSLSHQLIRNVPEFGRHVVEQEQVRINVDIKVGEAKGSQIYGVYIDQFVIKTHDAREAFRCLITDPLKDWAKHRSKPDSIVLLVDGLDEAMKLWHRPNIFDLIEQARDLPKAVRWVLTSRPGEHLSSLRGADLVLLKNSSENQSDVRAYADAFRNEPAMAMALAAQKLDDSAYFDQLVQRSQGNFLYLRLVFEQLRRQTSAGQPLTTPSESPSGLEDLYREFLKRLTRSRLPDYWREFLRPVLSVLAVARDALDFEELCRLSGASRQAVNDVLSELAELLDSGLEGDGPYRFYHPSFPEFLTDRTSSRKFWIDPVEHHRAIADLYLTTFRRNWKNCGDYGLRFLAHHLTLSGRRLEFINLLVSDSSWIDTKAQRIGQGAVRDDLEIAAGAFTDPVSAADALVLAQVWILERVADTLSSAYFDSTLEALLALGREEDAINHVRCRTDPQQRFIGLKRLLSLKLAVDGPTSRLLTETLIAADQIADNEQRATTVNEIVGILNPTERFDDILKAVRSLEPVRPRAEALKALASWPHQSNNPTTAQRGLDAGEILILAAIAASEMSDPAEKTRMLHEIAVAQIDLGDKRAGTTLNDAASASAKIISVHRRAELQEQVACSLGDAGLFDAAVKLAREIPYDRYAEITKFGVIFMTTPGSISEDDHQATALNRLSHKLITAGKYDEAIDASLRIGNILYRDMSLTEIALTLVEQGALEEAKKVAYAIDVEAFEREGRKKADAHPHPDAFFEGPLQWGREEALEAISKASLEKGKVEDKADHAQALQETSQIENKEIDSPPPESLPTARSDSVKAFRPRFSDALTSIVEILIDSDRNHEALRIAELIPNEAIKTEAKTKIGLALIESHRYHEALSLTAGSKESHEKICSEIITAHLEAREFDEAFRIAGAIEDQKKGTTELARIARALFDSKQFKKAFDTARSITLDVQRIELLASLASARISSNRREATKILNEALSESREKLSVKKRAAALVALLDPLQKLKPERASELIDEILESADDSDDTVNTLCKLGCWLAKDDENRASEVFEQAVEAAHELPSDDDLHALLVVGGSMRDADVLDANDVFDEALSMAADRYEDEGEELVDFIDKYLERRDADECYSEILDAAQRITDDYERTEALLKLAKSLAELCMEEAVEDVVMSVDDESERQFVQAEVDARYVKNRANFGNFGSETWEIAENIEFEEQRNAAFDYMGSKIAYKLDCDQALEIIRKATNPAFLRRAVPGVIRALVRANRLREAAEVASPKGLAASLSHEEEEVIQARSEVAERLAVEGKFREAFGSMLSRDLDRSIGALATWSSSLDQLKPDFRIQMLTEVSRISGWVQSDWRDVHNVLSDRDIESMERDLEAAPVVK